jgi:hypothetical protein
VSTFRYRNGDERKIRLGVQALYPESFELCPACKGHPLDQTICALCASTGLVTHIGASNWRDEPARAFDEGSL